MLGTDLDIESIRKAKPVGILKEFAPFQKDGFELNPQVSVPSSILSALKRMQASSRTVLSGPSAVAPSEFMMLVMESDFKISEFK